jgi:hypothetical protein
MDFNLNTPNSRMILDLLMKNAAKYDESAEKEHVGENTFGEESKMKKSDYVKLNSKPLPLKIENDIKASIVEFETKGKTEQFKEVKTEYTEVKTEETGCELTESIVKKENMGIDQLGLENKKSIILDILNNNVAKYADSSTFTKKKRRNSNDTREKNKKFKQDENYHLEIEDHTRENLCKTDLLKEIIFV